MNFLARVRVVLKPVVNDPQGLTVAEGLHSLGFSEVRDVRAGKLLEITLDAPDAATAGARVQEMARRLLANPVIEDFTYTLAELPDVVDEPAEALAGG